jgi:hypothetical protein
MYSSNREAYRQQFIEIWQKYQNQVPLNLQENRILDVILAHPEYQLLLTHQNKFQNFELEENPFLHMSLHIALQEQITLNRPVGIRQICEKLNQKYSNPHEVEHCMIHSLKEVMWQAQQKGIEPSEQEYLQKLRALL